MRGLIMLGLLCIGANASAVTTEEWSHITFSRSAGGTYSISYCHPFGYCGSASNQWWFFNNDNLKPAGATTQWMVFTFKSEGYFSHLGNTGHFISGLHANFDIPNAEVDGHGPIVGAIVAHPDSCNVAAPYSQIETFWGGPSSGGNAAWDDTCIGSLQDGVEYKFIVHSSDSRWLTYEIQDTAGNRLHLATVYDDKNPESIQSNVGWFLTTVQDTGGPWTIRVTNFSTGWF